MTFSPEINGIILRNNLATINGINEELLPLETSDSLCQHLLYEGFIFGKSHICPFWQQIQASIANLVASYPMVGNTINVSFVSCNEVQRTWA